LLVIAVIGGALWVTSERAAVARAAESDLDESERRLKSSEWAEARTAIERTKARLGDGGSAKLRSRLEKAERDLKFADRIDKLRLKVDGHVGGGPELARAADAELGEVFRDAGFGTPADSPEIVAERVISSHVRSAIVAVLDDWTSKASDDRDKQKWLHEVARLADPDTSAWRQKVRGHISDRNEKALFELIDSAPPLAEQPATFLLTLDRCLDIRSPERIKFLTRIQEAHSSDYWVNLRLANALSQLGRYAESLRYFQAALAIRPNAAFAHNNLGTALSALGRLEDALTHHEKAAALDPTTGNLQYNLAVVLWRLNRKDELIPYLQKAIELDPADKDSRFAIRVARVQLGKAEDVRRDWKQSLESDPAAHEAWHGYAELCLLLRNEEEYRRVRSLLLAKFGETADFSIAERISRASLVLPASGDELRQAASLAERAASLDRKRIEALWRKAKLSAERPGIPERMRVEIIYRNFQFARGLAEFRQGHFDRAISIMNTDAKGAHGTAAAFVLAMSLQATGQDAQARKVLSAAVLAGDWRISRAGDQDSWMCHALRREAEQRIVPRVKDFLQSEYEPQNNDERLCLVGACQSTGRTRALATLYAAAFADNPRLADDTRCDHLALAANAAACASAGQGTDAANLDETEKTKWRQTAHEHLRAKFTAVMQSVQQLKMERTVAARYLTHWQREPDLAAVRDASRIAKMPKNEQQDWRKLWKEVAIAIAMLEGTR
jgi:tetratricopeptide (TPR) repeat protein